MPDYPDTQLLIDGQWRDGADGRTLPVVDPATEDTIGTVAHAETPDLDDALAAADKAFKVWSATPAVERSKVMHCAADLLRERARDIGWILTREQGKPLAEAVGETMSAADMIDWCAEESRRTYGWVIPARAPGVVQMAIKQPVGAVAAFTPWNFPINQVVRKVGAALAAGCSIIVKAAEETPASAAALIRAFADAGLPPGVVNLVYGVPAEISEYLIPHPLIRKISFTGSTAVGKQLASLAGQHMKRSTMELGGHAPAIVCDDADVGKAVKLLASLKYLNAGQACIAPTRLMVQDSVYDRFLDGFVAAAGKIKVGNGLDDGVRMGPLANDRRIAALEALIKDAVESGGRLAAGGQRIGNKGYFFQPTVLAEVPTTARIMIEEPFGPVAIVNRFATLDDAVAEGNRLTLGLAAYAFTGSNATAQALAASVEAGMISINHFGLATPEAPFGGVKDSGYGSEGGADAIEPYLVTKFVSNAAR
ncbi:MAG: NAD-dependent succinate-semialdehyde dehydrogenase [Rhodospirillales bacterium]|nr:NAD-dependent succinate-semialdehyde dehydrogenase [Rhodospirillales bacterium]